MKHPKIITLLLFAALLLGLCACGGESAPAAAPEATPAPEITPVPAVEPAATPEATPEPTPEPTPEAAPESDAKAIAEALVDSDVSELYEAVGYPISSSYAPSCLGDGEDGELIYDGFTVYTFKAASGVETVTVVL